MQGWTAAFGVAQLGPEKDGTRSDVFLRRISVQDQIDVLILNHSATASFECCKSRPLFLLSFLDIVSLFGHSILDTYRTSKCTPDLCGRTNLPSPTCNGGHATGEFLSCLPVGISSLFRVLCCFCLTADWDVSFRCLVHSSRSFSLRALMFGPCRYSNCCFPGRPSLPRRLRHHHLRRPSVQQVLARSFFMSA